jgi:hypothetical protein
MRLEEPATVVLLLAPLFPLELLGSKIGGLLGVRELFRAAAVSGLWAEQLAKWRELVLLSARVAQDPHPIEAVDYLRLLRPLARVDAVDCVYRVWAFAQALKRRMVRLGLSKEVERVEAATLGGASSSSRRILAEDRSCLLVPYTDLERRLCFEMEDPRLKSRVFDDEHKRCVFRVGYSTCWAFVVELDKVSSCEIRSRVLSSRSL